jgi:threonine dehydrogenase-like Zn-dependent dehydrogenase
VARACGADHVLLAPRPSDLASEVRRLTRGGKGGREEGGEEARHGGEASEPQHPGPEEASRGVHVHAHAHVPTQLYGGLPVDGVHAVYDGVGLATWEASLGPNPSPDPNPNPNPDPNRDANPNPNPWEASLDALRPRGTAVLFGNASGAPPAVPPLLLAAKGSLSLTRPKLHDFLSSREEALTLTLTLTPTLTLTL